MCVDLLTWKSGQPRDSIFARCATLSRWSHWTTNRQLHRCRSNRFVGLRSTGNLDIARALVVIVIVVRVRLIPVVVRLPVSLPVLPVRPVRCLVVSLLGTTSTWRHCCMLNDSRQCDNKN